MSFDADKIIALSPVPFCLVQKGLITHANRQMSQLLGYAGKELEHLMLEQLIFPADRKEIRNFIQAVSSETVIKSPLKIRMLHCRGQILPLLAFFRLCCLKNIPTLICQFIDQDCLEEMDIIQQGKKARGEALRLREIMDQFDSGVAIYQAIEKGKDFIIRDFNPAAERIDQIKQQDVLGRLVSEVFPNIRRWGLFEVFTRVWKTEEAEYFPAYIHLDARTVGWRESYVFKIHTGEIVSVYRDITQWKQGEMELKDSEKRFREIFSQSPIGIAIYGINGRLADANRAFLEFFGLPDAESVKGWELLSNPDDPQWLKNNLADGEPVKYTQEVDFDRLKEQGVLSTGKTGRCYFDYLVSPLKTEGNKCYGFLMQVQDITARKLAEAKLEYLSLHDSLTGCYNRAYFDQEVKRLEESRVDSLGVIIFDVDGLKLINDTLGHSAGDDLLIAGANLIKSCFRAGDMVARIGGDEFVVLLPNGDALSVQSGCERVREAITHYNAGNPQVPLSISMGSAFGQGLKQAARLLKEADDQLYREKAQRKKDAHLAIVETIMHALKEKDFFAQGHGSNLERLGAGFAQALGLDRAVLHRLDLLTQIHDIGKVMIPNQIIFKPGPLTPAEEAEIQRHCEIGQRIALSAPGMAEVADLILKHHEWWNGAGYPLGIKGEAIPLECRIFGILDAFETMTHDRPYRKALPAQVAVQELLAGARSQFDPFLVQRFLDFLS